MTGITGLTDPFHGGTASSYVHAHGYTFRWVKGDRYVAVMRGTCVDARRVLLIKDRLTALGEAATAYRSPRTTGTGRGHCAS